MSLEIMISGVGRSGTTALYEIVQQLIRSNGLDPTCRYEPYLWRSAAFERLAFDDRAFADAFKTTSSLSIEGMYAHAQTPLFARSSPPEHAAFIDDLFTGREPTLVKVIRGCGRLDAFVAARPGLKIIQIVRNPIDVVNSALGLFSFFGEEYHPSDKPRFVREVHEHFGATIAQHVCSESEWSGLWWRYMNQAALETAAQFPARVLALSHEALRSAPGATVRRIATFCELDPEQVMSAELRQTPWSSGARAKLDEAEMAALRALDEHYWSHMLPGLDRDIDFDRGAVARAVAAKYASTTGRKGSPLDAIPRDLVGPALRAQLTRDLQRLPPPERQPKEPRWRRKGPKLVKKLGARLATLAANNPLQPRRRKPRAGRIKVIRAHPPIACIITNYNNGGALKDAVLSVCSQTFPVTEIIVADDASTDGSPDLIGHLSNEFPNIKPIFNEHNRGPGLNRHLAILAAISPFITQLDGDDVIHPRKIEQETAVLKGDMNAVAFSDWLAVDLAGRNRRSETAGFAALKSRRERLKTMLLRSMPLPHNMLYSRDLYLKTGGYDTSARMYEDLTLKLRLAQEVRDWRHAVGYGLYYNHYGKGVSSSVGPVHLFWLLYCMAQNFDWIKRELTVDDLREAILVWFGRLVPDPSLVDVVTRNLRSLGPDEALSALERALFQLARARKTEISLADAAEVLERFEVNLTQSRSIRSICLPELSG